MNTTNQENHDVAAPSQRNLLVMKASAGSGKTYNLALQYIQHLLFYTDDDGLVRPRRQPGDNRLLNAHRLLLAITFTNKATTEMKERIVKELYRLSQDGMKSDYLAGFMALSGLREAQVRTLARQALSELLFDYSNFNVSTIDSFFQSVLRNFARELDRDFNYDIQLEEDYAVSVAVHNFLLSLGKRGQQSQVDEWVKEYQRHMLRGDVEKKQWKFFDDRGSLLNLAKQIKTELFRSSMEDIRAYLGECDEQGRYKMPYKSDFSLIREFKRQMHALGQQAVESCKQLQADLYRLLDDYGSRNLLNYTLKNWYNAGGQQPIQASLRDKINEGKLDGQFKKKANVSPEVLEGVERLAQGQWALMNAADFLRDIEDNLGLLGMLAMIDLSLEDYRHETNSILIGDTNDLIGAVLESGSEFVYERVGSTIAHFMIDEFQDTSTKQYENFKGLLRESLASGNFNMLIGDAKQSIYRFRNADPTVFREKVDIDFKDDIYQPPVEPDAPASINYRSSRNIIEFNNRLFTFMLNRYSDVPAVASSYRDVVQGFPGNVDTDKVPGYVRVLLGDYKGLLDDPVIAQASLLPAAGTDGDAPGDVDVLTVLPGYLLRLHERYDWGRIGILVNSNREGNSIVERILEYNQHATGDRINIISGESLLLNNSPIIRRIIAMLRFIDISNYKEHDDDGEQAEGTAAAPDLMSRRLRSKRASDQRLFAAMDTFIKAVTAAGDADAVAVGDLLVQSVSSDPAAAAATQAGHAAMLASMLPSGYELTTLVSIVENIIGRFKADPTACADVDRETAFLMAFQDEVLSFSGRTGGGSVREFLKYWDEMKGRLAVSSADGGDAINIMTIHKAKGLEFDCVIVPFANWFIIGNGQMTEHYWMPREAFIEVLESLPLATSGIDGKMVPPLVNVSRNHLVQINDDYHLKGEAARYLDKQQTDQMIDNMNKTYVAFTRPCSEMHIFAACAKKGEERTVSRLLSDFAAGGDTLTPMGEGSDVKWFDYGEVSSREQLEAKRPARQSQGTTGTIGGYRVAPVPPGIRVRLDNASGSRIGAGVRLHGLLSRIGDRRDVERVIADGIKHGIITLDGDDPCGVDNVNALVKEPILAGEGRVAAWFDPANRVYSERTITTASDSLWDNGIENVRPDRIVRRPDGQILVIDYKTGEQRRDKKYCRQVADYIAKLREVFPDAPIAGRIWYTTLGVILDERGRTL